MEEYKRALCWYFNQSTSEEEIYDNIKDDPRYTCNLNEDGLLHSNYNGTHYKPAIIYCQGTRKMYFWMFNGIIKDCEHPFIISINDNLIVDIHYYSSDRIRTDQPIIINYINYFTPFLMYNEYINQATGKNIKILNGEYKYGMLFKVSEYDRNKIMFTSEWYPLWDEIEPPFKFAD